MFYDGESIFRRIILMRLILGGGGIWKTVSGVSPLSLTNALSSRIKSLVQYGKCTTSGGDTYCNNGKLVAVDDELPIGYRRIVSIKFDGDFWYELGEALTGEDDVTMTLDDTVSTGQNVFGSYNGTASGKKNFSLYIYGGSSTNSSYLRYGEQLVRPKLGSDERTITFGKSGTSGFQTDVTVTPEEFTTPANACIGMLPNSSSPAYTGSITGNVLIGTRLKYIPCERVSDSEIGYYEAVNGEFIEKTGTGVPTKGAYDTSHLNVLMVDGTPEVLTVSAAGETPQTVSVVNLFATDDVADEHDIISGVVVRNTEVVVSNGVITIQALQEPVIENVSPQSINTVEGNNTLAVTSEVSGIEFDVTYKASS